MRFLRIPLTTLYGEYIDRPELTEQKKIKKIVLSILFLPHLSGLEE